jgi:hypothetical protein
VYGGAEYRGNPAGATPRTGVVELQLALTKDSPGMLLLLTGSKRYSVAIPFLTRSYLQRFLCTRESYGKMACTNNQQD